MNAFHDFNDSRIYVPRSTRRFYDIPLATSKETSIKETPIAKKEEIPSTHTPVEIPVVTIVPRNKEQEQVAKKDNILLSYDDINHHKGRLFFHIWIDEKVLAVTSKDVTFNTTEDYMVMILRFPFSSKSQYFATATSFIDAGLADMSYVDTLEELSEMELD